MIRAKTHFEKVRSGRNAIVATELPYLVTKSELLAKTADAINARRIEGIADLRDESGREGTRVVFELKRDAQAEIVLSNLFKSTRLQTSFPANIVAVDHALNDDGDDVRSPVRMTLRYALERWLGFRFDCVRLRAAHSERRAAARLHIVEGLCLATANVDAVVALIRAAKESEIPNFKGSYLGRFPLVLADFWTSDHLLERFRSVDAFFGTRARGTLTLKRR